MESNEQRESQDAAKRTAMHWRVLQTKNYLVQNVNCNVKIEKP